MTTPISMHRTRARSGARPCCATMVAAVVLGASAPARADHDSEAAAHYELASGLVAQNRFADAAVEFRRAYDLSPRYEVLYNIAQSYIRLGRSVEAVETLHAYIREGGAKIPRVQRMNVEADIVEQQRYIGEIDAHIVPEAASLRVDGREAGPGLIRIDAGKHTLSASLGGYVPAEQSVDVLGGGSTTVELRLTPAPAPPTVELSARVVVVCSVPGVTVTIDGATVGVTPLPTPLAVLPGDRPVTFSRPGYEESRQVVSFKPAEKLQVRCATRPLSSLSDSLKGWLTVDSGTAGATLLLDGGRWPPGGAMPFGPHTVEARREGFEPHTVETHLKPGERAMLRFTLTPTVATVEKVRARAQRQLTWAAAVGGVGVVGVVVGAVGGLLALGKRGTILRECKNIVHCTPTGKDAADSAHAYAVVSNISFPVGFAGLLIGGELLLTTPVEGGTIGGAAASTRLAPSSDGLRFTVGGAF